MSFDWAGIAQATGQGAAHGLATYKQETKEKEEKDYTRGREAVQDQQKAELHGQAVKQNDFTLQSNAREQAEANRKQLLNERLGRYQNFKTTGDIDQAAKNYVEFANQDNSGNPNFDRNHALSYVKNADGTVNINIVDKNTGALIRAAKENATTDDFIAATYQQLDPTKSYETEVSNKAASALKQQEYNWEERKLGLNYNYDIGKEGVKYGYNVGLEGVKHGNNIQLEGIRQEGANYRTGLTQDGLNYRDGNNGGGAGGTGTGKASSAVASGVQGAINFAQQNAPMLSFLSNNPDLYNKTVAMMGIESGGNNKPSYNGSSFGPMQLHTKYAQYHADKYGIPGDPINNPAVNIKTGAAHLAALDKKYGGNADLVGFAYNAGEGVVDGAISRWQKSGQKGNWIDYVQLNPTKFNEAYNHAIKYNQALGLLDGNMQPTGLTPQQQTQNNAQQSVNGKAAYRQNLSATIAASVKTAATNMGTELGLDKGANAALIGGLAGTQTEIAKFANGNSKAERAAAYNNIAVMVDRAVQSTEAGMAMTPAQRLEYSYQKTAELVGAANKGEAGVWINNGRFPQQAAKPKQQSNLSSNEIDNVFGEINVGSVQKQGQAKPAAKSGAFVPMRNPMQGDGAIKAASRFEPPKTTAKAAPAAKPAAAKPKSQMDKNMEARAARKKAQADEINKRVTAQKAEAGKPEAKPAAKKPAMTNQQAQAMFGTSAVDASKALKLRLQQNKS